MSWNHFRRRRNVSRSDGAPVLQGDTWFDPRHLRQLSAARMAAVTWRRRIGTVKAVVGYAAGRIVGTEVRRGVESRGITSLPWSTGRESNSSVNVDQALRLTSVFAAGRLLASNVASMPIQQYRRTSDGRTKLQLSPLFAAPSVQGTVHDWLFRAVTSLAYRGNAVGLITGRDRYEFPTMIEWLNPDYIQVIDAMPILGRPGSYTNPIWYYLGKPIPAEDILHIPWFTLPGKVWGLSPVAAYATTVATGLAAQEFSKDWFDSGGVPPGTFANADKEVDQDTAEIVKQRLVQSIKSRQPIVYGKSWSYTPITVSANEAKFIDTMRLTASQIAAIYGIPPELIGGETGGSMSYSSPEQRQIEFVQFALLPWLTKLEHAFNSVLPRGQYVKFNVDALIRTDLKTRYEAYEKARLIGLMSLDEMREREDMAPLPNGQGTDHTPLPIQAGAKVSVPPIRGADPAGLHLIKDVNDG